MEALNAAAAPGAQDEWGPNHISDPNSPTFPGGSRGRTSSCHGPLFPWSHQMSITNNRQSTRQSNPIYFPLTPVLADTSHLVWCPEIKKNCRKDNNLSHSARGSALLCFDPNSHSQGVSLTFSLVLTRSTQSFKFKISSERTAMGQLKRTGSTSRLGGYLPPQIGKPVDILAESNIPSCSPRKHFQDPKFAAFFH